MTTTALPAETPTHRNAFGFLRLLFACLVIVSHGPQLIDGNALREPMVALTGNIIGLGSMAVDGFFVISGYLVVASYCKQPSAGTYLARRITRIVPGFLVACGLCILVVAPLGGADWAAIAERWPQLVWSTISLQQPLVPGAFAGTPHGDLNGSMWTIIHEFRAYLLVILLGALGLFRARLAIPFVAAALYVAFSIVDGLLLAPHAAAVISALIPIADLSNALRLTATFLVGSCFFLFRDAIPLRLSLAAVAGAILASLLFVAPLAKPASVLLGGYIIFAVGFGVTRGPLARINNGTDISYGVYLYAWPIQKLLLWYWPALPVWPCVLLTALLACAIGWISWYMVEKPALALLTGKRDTSDPAAPASRNPFLRRFA